MPTSYLPCPDPYMLHSKGEDGGGVGGDAGGSRATKSMALDVMSYDPRLLHFLPCALELARSLVSPL